MGILLALQKQDVVDLLQIPLEIKLSIAVNAAITPELAEQVLSKGEVTHVIIDADEAILPKVQKIISDKKLKVVFCYKDAEKKVEGLDVLGALSYSPNILDELLKLLQSISKNSSEDAAVPKAGDDGKYFGVRTSLLVKMSPLDVDVYIRLSATHYVKIFQKGNVFDGEDLKKYAEKKKVQYMFLQNDSTKILVDKVNGKLKDLLKQEKIEIKEVKETVEDVVDTVHQLIDQMGVTEEVQELVKNNIDVAVKAMGDFPELAKILKEMTADPSNYISGHSMMLAHVACSMACAVDWYSETTFQKLTMAAFMHDSPIKNQELCAVKNLEELEKKFKGKFTPEQVAIYKSHPDRASKLVAQFKEMPPEVDKIILQHHEHPYGTGFPGALSSNYIAPLASLFIIAHDIVDYCYDNKGNIDIDEFLETNSKKYSAGNFKKIAKAVSEMTFT